MERKVPPQLDRTSAVEHQGRPKGAATHLKGTGRGNALDTLQRVVRRASARSFGSQKKRETKPPPQTRVDGTHLIEVNPHNGSQRPFKTSTGAVDRGSSDGRGIQRAW
jgi:hypothetical protein